jgi:hypothetical protein
MRRLYSSLAIFGLMGTIAGCHTSGVCDCIGPGNPCCYGNVAVTEAGEPARAMPRADIRELDAGKPLTAPEKLSPPADSGK